VASYLCQSSQGTRCQQCSYKPTTPTDNDLFQEKQKYLYAVLESKVEMTKGKAIIHKYESTFDAQKAYADRTDHHLNSTKVSLNSTKILGYIASAKIGDGSWHGTAVIRSWQEQVRLYEHLVPLSGHCSDEQKLSMLQTAFHCLQELCLVKATAALLKTRTKKDLDYNAYTTLLLSAATDYDSKHMIYKGKRLAYAHDMMDHDNDDFNDAPYEVASFDIDWRRKKD
jgi:hypothetical protein